MRCRSCVLFVQFYIFLHPAMLRSSNVCLLDPNEKQKGKLTFPFSCIPECCAVVLHFWIFGSLKCAVSFMLVIRSIPHSLASWSAAQ
jgi:hypothetical protein